MSMVLRRIFRERTFKHGMYLLCYGWTDVLTMVCCCSCETHIERARYPLFVNVLNKTLLYLQTQGDEVEDGDIISAINDPVVIETKHLDTMTK